MHQEKLGFLILLGQALDFIQAKISSPKFQQRIQLQPIFIKNGAENRIRTDDLRITNALLYQLSYLGKFKISTQF